MSTVYSRGSISNDCLINKLHPILSQSVRLVFFIFPLLVCGQNWIQSSTIVLIKFSPWLFCIHYSLFLTWLDPPQSLLPRSQQSRQTQEDEAATVWASPCSGDTSAEGAAPCSPELRRGCSFLIRMLSVINMKISPLSTLFSMLAWYPVMLIDLNISSYYISYHP